LASTWTFRPDRLPSDKGAIIAIEISTKGLLKVKSRPLFRSEVDFRLRDFFPFDIFLIFRIPLPNIANRMKSIAFGILTTTMAMYMVKGDLDVQMIEKAFTEAEDLL
jgi:hypothetical protein